MCPWADHMPSEGPHLPSVGPFPPLENKNIESMSFFSLRRQWPPSSAVDFDVKGLRKPEAPPLAAT